MGYDHAEQKELDPPTAASSSSSGVSDKGNQKEWPPTESRDSIVTLPDDEDKREQGAQRKHRASRGGILKFRAADDDLPTDWWFASTAIPLIAATFAPMANLLSIGALVVSWRNNVVEPDNTLYYQATSVGYPDPAWCIDLNIASLVCGFVGNLFLLFNFTKRVRYIVALPTTIVLFYIASGILIGITVSMNVHVPPGKNQVYSQGFWNAVLAACLYMFNSMILMVNMWGYSLGHYPQHFTLSDEQRNLILQTMMFFIWLGGGAGVFSVIEDWTYPDAVYFCDVTILTVGFGDYYPTDDLARGLVFPFSVGGIVILGLMVSSIHKFAGELSSVNVLRKHVENRRVNTLSRVVTVEDVEDKKRTDLEKEFEVDRLEGRRLTISAPVPNPQIQRDLDAAAHGERGRRDTGAERPQGRLIGFEDTTIDDLKKTEDSEPHPHQFLKHPNHKGPIRATFKLLTDSVSTLKKVRTRSQKAILMREERDRFVAMREIQINARKFKKWYALLVSAMAFGILWCVGAVVFWRAEQKTQGLSYFQALYFCYVSLLTIGYGDLSPKSNAGKPFFVVWSLIAVPTMTILVSDMGDTVISSFKRGTFVLGDLTILPKKGLWHDFLKTNPWLLNWMRRRADKKRLKSGLPVGPGQDATIPTLTIEELASEEPTEPELVQRLAWAIRRTADDLQHAPGKRYSYEEWCDFTRLIRFTKVGLAQLEYDEERDGVVEWDWLEETSPMLSGQSESEWILDRLCESLLRLLKKNMLATASAPDSSVTNLSSFSFSRQATTTEDAPIDPKSPESAKGKGPGTDAAPATPTETQQRQRRASGADAVLTFFTGQRRGAHTYVSDKPQWSKKAHEKMKERRTSGTGKKRRGPFGKLEHKERTGAIGGGRGGAGIRTLKMRHMTGAGDGARFSPPKS